MTLLADLEAPAQAVEAKKPRLSQPVGGAVR
jgi:hypothetical protein